MKKIKIGFAAIIALAAMSFTIASNSKLFGKRTNILNCYKTITTANYLSVCTLPGIWTAIDCSNKTSALKHVVKKDLSVGTFSGTTVTCSGGNVLCCINFKIMTSDPCTLATIDEKKGDGMLKDFNGNIIPTTDWVLVNDIQCKP